MNENKANTVAEDECIVSIEVLGETSKRYKICRVNCVCESGDEE